MTYTKDFYRFLAIALATALLAACTPPPTTPATSNFTLELRRMQSTLDRQGQNIQNLAADVEELEKRLQRQAEELAQMRQAPRATEPSYQPTGIPQPIGASTIPQSEGSPTEVYLQAFGDYASGRYQAAIHGFESFLQRFPNNSYASNAQFWLGDCYFNQQQYSQAVVEFERILSDFPSAPKNPDALLKIAIAQLQLGETDEARQTISLLSQKYPKSSATQKAQELAIP